MYTKLIYVCNEIIASSILIVECFVWNKVEIIERNILHRFVLGINQLWLHLQFYWYIYINILLYIIYYWYIWIYIIDKVLIMLHLSNKIIFKIILWRLSNTDALQLSGFRLNFLFSLSDSYFGRRRTSWCLGRRNALRENVSTPMWERSSPRYDSCDLSRSLPCTVPYRSHAQWRIVNAVKVTHVCQGRGQ